MQDFSPFQHAGFANQHDCTLTDLAFRQSNLRVDCRDQRSRILLIVRSPG
jgi:hypothetical protein